MKRINQIYNQEIVPKMKQEFNYSNVLEVPKIKKISINVGIGKDKNNQAKIKKVANDLYKITGQKPRICKSKKAISGFKLVKGDIIGLSVTLRKKQMYEFLEKLLNVTLPRVRDFRGLDESSFDSNHNYTFGIKEHIIFPEISYDKIEEIYGMQISIATNAKSKKEAISLFKYLNFPLKGKQNG
jgi:large subunit ribosomal protein L5